jgi:hypothetical protein
MGNETKLHFAHGERYALRAENEGAVLQSNRLAAGIGIGTVDLSSVGLRSGELPRAEYSQKQDHGDAHAQVALRGTEPN